MIPKPNFAWAPWRLHVSIPLHTGGDRLVGAAGEVRGHLLRRSFLDHTRPNLIDAFHSSLGSKLYPLHQIAPLSDSVHPRPRDAGNSSTSSFRRYLSDLVGLFLLQKRTATPGHLRRRRFAALRKICSLQFFDYFRSAIPDVNPNSPVPNTSPPPTLANQAVCWPTGIISLRVPASPRLAAPW